MFSWLRNIVATSKPVRASQLACQAVRLLRARYDAAVTNDANYRHWANADGMSANSAASP